MIIRFHTMIGNNNDSQKILIEIDIFDQLKF